MNQIKVNTIAFQYLTMLADNIDARGFSKETRMSEAVDYVCERAAWLAQNQDNLYTYKDVDGEQKLVKVNFKTF